VSSGFRLEFGSHTYKWGVRVWDGGGLSSQWIYSTFQTPAHNYPKFLDPPFGISPNEPKLGDEVQFSGRAVCYDTTGAESECNWLWEFTDGKPATSDTQNPKSKFTTKPGEKQIKVKISDKDGLYSCEITKPIKIKRVLPKWREIFSW
jgi:hypothetical protein